MKREIVTASLAPGASVSVVARRYDVNANQVFRWRKAYRDGPFPLLDASPPGMIPVIVMAEQRGDGAAASSAADTIEIALVGGYRVRVGGGFDGHALRRARRA